MDTPDPKLLATAASGLLRRLNVSKDGQANSFQRMTLSEAVRAVKAIVACYPNGGQGAGDGYVGVMAAVLHDYPLATAMRAADPRRGIASAAKFLPSVAELVAWLDQEMNRGPAPRAYPVFEKEAPVSRSRRLSYQELNEKYGDGKGGWGTNTDPKSYTEMVKKYGRPIGRFEKAGDQWNRF